MHYLDTSLLVAAVTPEASTGRIKTWIRDHEDNLAISYWTLTEIAAALSQKVRNRDITSTQKTAALHQVEALRNTVLLLAPIDDTHYFAAGRFAGQSETGLRAGDALHVAIAADYDMTLVTLDKKMAMGADALGLNVVLLPSGMIAD